MKVTIKKLGTNVYEFVECPKYIIDKIFEAALDLSETANETNEPARCHVTWHERITEVCLEENAILEIINEQY
ncbi:hypothetical protein ACFYU8_06720 [Brevibacillus sp. NPDC003359]|uniref:hypothetical protein n=1 Tax=unclassified Brevibacillus TaxID=2684853 RepID=UPI0036CA38EE